MTHAVISAIAMLGAMTCTAIAPTEKERAIATMITIAIGFYFLGTLYLLVQTAH